MRVYLDNAATTAIDPEVVDVISDVMKNKFGNPSSIHNYGREARALIEESRKKVAKYLNASPSEIFFTSGGTEANNATLRCCVRDLGIKHIITSKIEHHAVLYTAQALEKEQQVKLSYVDLKEDGHIDLAHLEELLKNNEHSLVSLMHANNEIGNLISLKDVGEICKKYDALFHSDTVQTMAHYKIDVQDLNVHFLTCSSHKFHGPKGIGFLYIRGGVKINPFIYGGSQERNMRGGTENIYGIVGLAKAMEIAYRDIEEHHKHVQGLKTYMIEQLRESIPGIAFNGDCENACLYTVLNVRFPKTENAEMLLMNLDIAGIAASGGSACTSGSDAGSHVLRGINSDMQCPSVRFSFSKYNTKEELDYCVEKLKELFLVKA